jgi:Arc/MetJ-type ribon-helix-helix transcriptional regulator
VPSGSACSSMTSASSRAPSNSAMTLAVMEASPSMVVGMATKKITVTLDEAQLARIRSLVESGKAASVSGFVQHAVGVSLDDVAGWGAMLAEALAHTGGDLSAEEKEWADRILGTAKRRKRSAA